MKCYITRDSAFEDVVILWLTPNGADPPESKHGLWFRSGNDAVRSCQIFIKSPISINPGEIKEVKIVEA